jgi:fumarylacetoacetase
LADSRTKPSKPPSPRIATLNALAESRVSLQSHPQDIVDFDYAVSMKSELEHGASTTPLTSLAPRVCSGDVGRCVCIAITGVTYGLEIFCAQGQ